MTEYFIPSKNLNNSELKLLNATKQKFSNARSVEELLYYELVLDVLMISALNMKKREMRERKEHFEDMRQNK